MDESTHAPSLIELVQPGTFDILRPGCHRLRIDPEGFYWPGHNRPVDYGDIGLSVVRLYTEARGKPISHDGAEQIARWCLHFRSAPEHKTELHDWLVSSFFTIAGEKAPRFANGLTYMRVNADSVHLAGILDEAVVKPCIEKAESSHVHFKALREAAKILRHNGQPLGNALTDWAVDAFLESDPPRGKSGRLRLTLRDRAIVATIERLLAEGLKVTNSVTAVADAMSVDYETISKVWKARPKDA